MYGYLKRVQNVASSTLITTSSNSRSADYDDDEEEEYSRGFEDRHHDDDNSYHRNNDDSYDNDSYHKDDSSSSSSSSSYDDVDDIYHNRHPSRKYQEESKLLASIAEHSSSSSRKKKRMLVLVNNATYANPEDQAKQSTSLILLESQGIVPIIVDGGSAINYQKRNELFEISGLKRQYPQFFLVPDDENDDENDDDSENTSSNPPFSLGGYETIQQLLKEGHLNNNDLGLVGGDNRRNDDDDDNDVDTTTNDDDDDDNNTNNGHHHHNTTTSSAASTLSTTPMSPQPLSSSMSTSSSAKPSPDQYGMQSPSPLLSPPPPPLLSSRRRPGGGGGGFASPTPSDTSAAFMSPGGIDLKKKSLLALIGKSTPNQEKALMQLTLAGITPTTTIDSSQFRQMAKSNQLFGISGTRFKRNTPQFFLVTTTTTTADGNSDDEEISYLGDDKFIDQLHSVGMLSREALGLPRDAHSKQLGQQKSSPGITKRKSLRPPTRGGSPTLSSKGPPARRLSPTTSSTTSSTIPPPPLQQQQDEQQQQQQQQLNGPQPPPPPPMSPQFSSSTSSKEKEENIATTDASSSGNIDSSWKSSLTEFNAASPAVVSSPPQQENKNDDDDEKEEEEVNDDDEKQQTNKNNNNINAIQKKETKSMSSSLWSSSDVAGSKNPPPPLLTGTDDEEEDDDDGNFSSSSRSVRSDADVDAAAAADDDDDSIVSSSHHSSDGENDENGDDDENHRQEEELDNHNLQKAEEEEEEEEDDYNYNIVPTTMRTSSNTTTTTTTTRDRDHYDNDDNENPITNFASSMEDQHHEQQQELHEAVTESNDDDDDDDDHRSDNSSSNYAADQAAISLSPKVSEQRQKYPPQNDSARRKLETERDSSDNDQREEIISRQVPGSSTDKEINYDFSKEEEKEEEEAPSAKAQNDASERASTISNVHHGPSSNPETARGIEGTESEETPWQAYLRKKREILQEDEGGGGGGTFTPKVLVDESEEEGSGGPTVEGAAAYLAYSQDTDDDDFGSSREQDKVEDMPKSHSLQGEEKTMPSNVPPTEEEAIEESPWQSYLRKKRESYVDRISASISEIESAPAVTQQEEDDIDSSTGKGSHSSEDEEDSESETEASGDDEYMPDEGDEDESESSAESEDWVGHEIRASSSSHESIKSDIHSEGSSDDDEGSSVGSDCEDASDGDDSDSSDDSSDGDGLISHGSVADDGDEDSAGIENLGHDSKSGFSEDIAEEIVFQAQKISTLFDDDPDASRDLESHEMAFVDENEARIASPKQEIVESIISSIGGSPDKDSQGLDSADVVQLSDILKKVSSSSEDNASLSPSEVDEATDEINEAVATKMIQEEVKAIDGYVEFCGASDQLPDLDAAIGFSEVNTTRGGTPATEHEEDTVPFEALPTREGEYDNRNDSAFVRAPINEEVLERSVVHTSTEEEEARIKAEEEARRLEQERLEQERREQERIAAEKDEAERIAKVQAAAEAQRLEQERLEQEHIQAEEEARRLEQERLEHERLEQESIAAEKAERIAKEQAAAEAQRLEQERLEQERLEQERIAAAKAEAERIAKEQAATEAKRLQQERLEQERLEQERIAAEADQLQKIRVAAEKEAERIANEKVAAERLEQERLQQERIAAEQAAELARLEEERIAAEKASESERLEQERIAEEKAAEAERLEQERIASEEIEEAAIVTLREISAAEKKEPSDANVDHPEESLRSKKTPVAGKNLQEERFLSSTKSESVAEVPASTQPTAASPVDIDEDEAADQRRSRIEAELDEIINNASGSLKGKPMKPKAIEALHKAAPKLAYRRRFYDAETGKIIEFPTVAKSIVEGTLFDEARKYFVRKFTAEQVSFLIEAAEETQANDNNDYELMDLTAEDTPYMDFENMDMAEVEKVLGDDEEPSDKLSYPTGNKNPHKIIPDKVGMERSELKSSDTHNKNEDTTDKTVKSSALNHQEDPEEREVELAKVMPSAAPLPLEKASSEVIQKKPAVETSELHSKVETVEVASSSSTLPVEKASSAKVKVAPVVDSSDTRSNAKTAEIDPSPVTVPMDAPVAEPVDTRNKDEGSNNNGVETGTLPAENPSWANVKEAPSVEGSSAHKENNDEEQQREELSQLIDSLMKGEKIDNERLLDLEVRTGVRQHGKDDEDQQQREELSQLIDSLMKGEKIDNERLLDFEARTGVRRRGKGGGDDDDLDNNKDRAPKEKEVAALRVENVSSAEVNKVPKAKTTDVGNKDEGPKENKVETTKMASNRSTLPIEKGSSATVEETKEQPETAWQKYLKKKRQDWGVNKEAETTISKDSDKKEDSNIMTATQEPVGQARGDQDPNKSDETVPQNQAGHDIDKGNKSEDLEVREVERAAIRPSSSNTTIDDETLSATKSEETPWQKYLKKKRQDWSSIKEQAAQGTVSSDSVKKEEMVDATAHSKELIGQSRGDLGSQAPKTKEVRAASVTTASSVAAVQEQKESSEDAKETKPQPETPWQKYLKKKKKDWYNDEGEVATASENSESGGGEDSTSKGSGVNSRIQALEASSSAPSPALTRWEKYLQKKNLNKPCEIEKSQESPPANKEMKYERAMPTTEHVEIDNKDGRSVSAIDPRANSTFPADRNSSSSTRMVALISKLSGNREQQANQDRAMTLLRSHGYEIGEIVDGSDVASRSRRNELFEISNIRGNYPQFFVVNGDRTSFFGNYDTVERMNDAGTLSPPNESVIEDSNPKDARSQSKDKLTAIAVPKSRPETNDSQPSDAQSLKKEKDESTTAISGGGDKITEAKAHIENCGDPRKAKINSELDDILEKVSSCRGKPLKPKTVEALKTAAPKVAYRRRYYDAETDRHVDFPDLAHTIVDGTLFEEVKKHRKIKTDTISALHAAAEEVQATNDDMDCEIMDLTAEDIPDIDSDTEEEIENAQNEDQRTLDASLIRTEKNKKETEDDDARGSKTRRIEDSMSNYPFRYEEPFKPLSHRDESEAETPAKEAEGALYSVQSDEPPSGQNLKTVEATTGSGTGSGSVSKDRIQDSVDQAAKSSVDIDPVTADSKSFPTDEINPSEDCVDPRKSKIRVEVDEIIQKASGRLQKPFKAKAVEALLKAAPKVAYRRKFYDADTDCYTQFPSVARAVVEGTLLEEARNYYRKFKDEQIEALQGAAEEVDGGRDDDIDYELMDMMAEDVTDIDSESHADMPEVATPSSKETDAVMDKSGDTCTLNSASFIAKTESAAEKRKIIDSKVDASQPLLYREKEKIENSELVASSPSSPVVEKWLDRNKDMPEDVEAACREMIPQVYRDQEVDAERMLRRTPSEELYKYLKQQLDYDSLHSKTSQRPREDPGHDSQNVGDTGISQTWEKEFRARKTINSIRREGSFSHLSSPSHPHEPLTPDQARAILEKREAVPEMGKQDQDDASESSGSSSSGSESSSGLSSGSASGSSSSGSSSSGSSSGSSSSSSSGSSASSFASHSASSDDRPKSPWKQQYLKVEPQADNDEYNSDQDIAPAIIRSPVSPNSPGSLLRTNDEDDDRYTFDRHIHEEYEVDSDVKSPELHDDLQIPENKAPRDSSAEDRESAVETKLGSVSAGDNYKSPPPSQVQHDPISASLRERAARDQHDLSHTEKEFPNIPKTYEEIASPIRSPDEEQPQDVSPAESPTLKQQQLQQQQQRAMPRTDMITNRPDVQTEQDESDGSRVEGYSPQSDRQKIFSTMLRDTVNEIQSGVGSSESSSDYEHAHDDDNEGRFPTSSGTRSRSQSIERQSSNNDNGRVRFDNEVIEYEIPPIRESNRPHVELMEAEQMQDLEIENQRLQNELEDVRYELSKYLPRQREGDEEEDSSENVGSGGEGSERSYDDRYEPSTGSEGQDRFEPSSTGSEGQDENYVQYDEFGVDKSYPKDMERHRKQRTPVDELGESLHKTLTLAEQLGLVNQNNTMERQEEEEEPILIKAATTATNKIDPPAYNENILEREGAYRDEDDKKDDGKYRVGRKPKKKKKKRRQKKKNWLVDWIPDPMADFVCKDVLKMDRRHKH